MRAVEILRAGQIGNRRNRFRRGGFGKDKKLVIHIDYRDRGGNFARFRGQESIRGAPVAELENVACKQPVEGVGAVGRLQGEFKGPRIVPDHGAIAQGLHLLGYAFYGGNALIPTFGKLTAASEP